MKNHAIIPIFIPHEGCPNDCVFCNQKKITARTQAAEISDMRETIEKYLSTLRNKEMDTIELAFFGGSFTGIPIEKQRMYLGAAKKYKDAGSIQKLHLSTRPDYINQEILDMLKEYGVDIIELGVQSFDDEVLKASNRGHDSKSVYESCKLIKEYGFELGIQLMIGLPEDNLEKALFSAKETARLAPSINRLYPTAVLAETELYNMYEDGRYKPLTQEEAIYITKEMYKIISGAGIKIIRVGLKSTDLISTKNGALVQSTYHPAFRQLVEGEIAREILAESIGKILAMKKVEAEKKLLEIVCVSNEKSFSNMIGHQKRNKLYFEEKLPKVKIMYKTDRTLADGHYSVIKC